MGGLLRKEFACLHSTPQPLVSNHHNDSRAQKTDRSSSPDHVGRQREQLQVICAAHGHVAEVQKDKKVTESEVPSEG